MTIIRRLAAVAAIVAMSAGSFGLCAGWAASAEARMACCVSGEGCPMHESESGPSGEGISLTQADADRCCAASEEESSTTAPAFVAAIAAAPLSLAVVTLEPPAAIPFDRSRAPAPFRSSHTPTHVLLSVFLI